MSDNQNVKNILEDVNKILIDKNSLQELQEIRLKKLREELSTKFEEYQKMMKFMAADAPLEVLCLPKTIENALFSHGCFRIYDLFNLDFTKVKGLGESRVRDLTSRLDEFLSML